ncbi:MAG: UDP-glucose 4-epimerase GalE [Desulfobacterales bacterium]|nr:UDP-glucose 4-epimerase GalE [Deltaproteobacteria bacterium]NNK93001.1 UDP-glucose 4-epimerase GalE [Desulfobacterales bacterium]
MKEILVVGGAGYIGSHMCKYLYGHGMRPVVLDNLSLGHREAVKWGPLYEGNMNDSLLLQEIFSKHSIDAAMHFAALCYVGESMSEPLKYYQNNISSTLGLLDAMLEHGVSRLIFSSTCATYGEPQFLPITEDHPQVPINPYGRSKLMMEQILDDLDASCGLKSVCLRYFNAAGADPEGELGEDHDPETHLIPLVLEAALGKSQELTILGDDYPTIDGTCVRDYIHIQDLSQAHYLSLQYLLDENPSKKFNLGNGNGYSIREVIQTAEEVTGRKLSYSYAERRPGDPAMLVGSAERISNELGWKPKYTTLYAIIETAWNWHVNNPDGFTM